MVGWLGGFIVHDRLKRKLKPLKSRHELLKWNKVEAC